MTAPDWLGVASGVAPGGVREFWVPSAERLYEAERRAPKRSLSLRERAKDAVQILQRSASFSPIQIVFRDQSVNLRLEIEGHENLRALCAGFRGLRYADAPDYQQWQKLTGLYGSPFDQIEIYAVTAKSLDVEFNLLATAIEPASRFLVIATDEALSRIQRGLVLQILDPYDIEF